VEYRGLIRAKGAQFPIDGDSTVLLEDNAVQLSLVIMQYFLKYHAIQLSWIIMQNSSLGVSCNMQNSLQLSWIIML
jgi:hypothetical protein